MPPQPARRPPPPLAVIVGPTASGKTDLALALAARMPLEVLVADSRQVYRGMEIGTAKPTPTARVAVRHHLLDLADPDAQVTAAGWVERARGLLPEIAARGAIPLVVGGTGLYVSALVDGFAFGGGSPPAELRATLQAALESDGLASLVARLREADPAAARTVDLRNPRRVLRALERAETSGSSAPGTATPYPGRVAMLGLARPPSVLDGRIEARARAMFGGGLLDEVAALAAAGFGPDLAPMSGHGYREAAAVLAGTMSLEEAVNDTVRRTRQYARRQMTWFRRDRRIVWLAVGERETDDPALVDRAADLLRRMLA